MTLKRFLLSPSVVYRSVHWGGPPTRTLVYLDRKCEDAEEDDSAVRIVFWSVLMLSCAAIYLIAFPTIRLCGLRRRIKFWQALKLQHNMYFHCAISSEYDEVMRAQAMLEELV